jgi:hypothetical protein
MSEDLLPCPFCSGNGHLEGSISYWVECEECGCSLDTVGVSGIG